MIRLIDEATRLGITIESAELPPGERSRYIASERRIVVSNRLGYAACGEAIVACLAFAEAGVTCDSPEARTLAAAYARDRLVLRAFFEAPTIAEEAVARETSTIARIGTFVTGLAVAGIALALALSQGVGTELTAALSAVGS